MASQPGAFARAHHVGSLIRPDDLIKAREAAARNEIAFFELRRIQEAAIREVVRLQEDLGFRIITDGEYNRGSWQRDFLLKFENVELVPSRITVKFHTREGAGERAPPSLQVTGRISRPRGIFVDDFKFLTSVARATPKVTFPSPSTLHFRGGRQAIDRQAYPDIGLFYDDVARVYREEIRDLAAAGCRFIQIDEVNLAYLCDPVLREEVQHFGEDPEELPNIYAKVLNSALAEAPEDMVVSMHLCRGNFAGAWIAEGGYEPIAELLFNRIDVDVYYLEYDSARAGGFEPLRFLPKGKIAVLGLMTTKSRALESKDEIKRRIEEASRFAPIEQLALSPQCGFSSGIGGNVMTVAEEIAKLRRLIEVAREVWGTA
ncbi:MAG TPA: 5-methyltetrahydropteroyltriglutamate--homocysteine S-methyltransferase [Xanthobacteraceae bacterium]